ncbi:MAG: PP2C family protein-serine/threonine phosphatase [Methanosarcina sp.]
MGIHVITYSLRLLADLASDQDLAVFDPRDLSYRYIIYGVIAIVIVYLLLHFQTRILIRTRKLLKEKEQALKIVDQQKAELEVKDKNLTDSLIYAQRIQEALLPSETYIRQFFSESFILFKPKDIVSGDFYWIEEKADKIFILAADCTGHGVPGALMSMIGHEIVEKAINEDGIEVPSQILAVLNKALEKTFSREKNIGNIIRDGMDVALCIIEKKKKKLVYSGAFLPIYLIRKRSLIEIKGDKIIIGMNPENRIYKDFEYDLQDNDVIYMFSDGYVDQFGGLENKKFMYRRFRYLLLNIHLYPFSDQKTILDENMKNWMGRNVQVDDIMVIGFRPLSAGIR